MHRYLAIVLAVSISSTAWGEEIPLKSIWALDMPGTQNVRELPSAKADERIIESIRRSLDMPLNPKDSKRSFVVLGTGDEALKQAEEILVGGKDAPGRFPANTELSIIFFSREFPYYVHISKVKRTKDAIAISYQFVPHDSADTTKHFAIIPIGSLKAGKYSVRIEPAPMDKKLSASGYSAPPTSVGTKVVSKSFNFVVGD
jgi:hypothetical protein